MKNRTERLVTTAVMIALGTILSFIKVWKMPMGGSVTLLSMLPVALVSLKYGAKWGFFGGFVYSIVQLMLDLGEVTGWGLTPTVLVGTILLDYILAYTALGFCGIFGKDTTFSIVRGISFAMVVRFLCHFISGSILFGIWAWDGWNVYLYSFCYNGLYMLPEMIFTIIGAGFLFRKFEF